MSLEKTLASVGQLLALVSRIANALSALSYKISAQCIQFWIDHPEALNSRLELAMQKPTVVQTIGHPLGYIRGLSALINMRFAPRTCVEETADLPGRNFDIFAIDLQVSERRTTPLEDKDVSEFVDIVILDDYRLFLQTRNLLKKSERYSKTIIVFVATDRDPELGIDDPEVIVLNDYAQVLKWLGQHQFLKIQHGLSERLEHFDPTHH